MKYDNFSVYVGYFASYSNNLALTIRPFIKIEKLSYRQLQKIAYQTAHYLLDKDVAKGDRVMVLANNSPQWLELFLGTQLIGATLVPIDAASNLTTALQFIKQTDPKIVFRSSHLHPELSKHTTVFTLDELEEAITNYSDEAPDIKLDGNEAAVIVFTSGTTADPKGVVLTQKNLLANISGIQQKIDISPDWRLLSVLPLSHMYELTGTLAVLSRGASIFYIPRVTPLGIAKALQDYHITTLLAIPQLLVLLLERIKQTAAEEGKGKILAAAWKLAGWLPFTTRRLLFRSVHSRLGGNLDLIVTGGAPIPKEVATAWERMGVKMVQGYGLTETSPILTVNGITSRRLDSPGQPLDNVRLRIAEDGEIQASGPSVFSKYWKNPSATEAAFTKDGWFKTGDVGHLQNDWLFIQGRLKFAIVLSSGLKVFPEDIELVAAKNDTFKGFCVVSLKQASGEAVLAVVTSDKSDQEVTKAIGEVNAQLESFQHIDSWRRWPDSDFPRTRLLKIDRRKVQDWANAAGQVEKPIKADKQTSKDTLVNVINLSLDEPKTHIEGSDRLADLGLDSLRRLTLVSLIEEQLGVTIAEADVTQTTTVSALRKLLSQGSRAEPSSSRPTWPFNRAVRIIGNGLRETIIRGIVRIWVKVNIEGQDQLDGLVPPTIFIFNHSDDFDGPVIYQSIPSHIRQYLTVAAADDVMRGHKVLAILIRLCFGGFNLSRREPYMPSLEYVGQMIDQGWSVVLSPEGRLSTDGKLQPFKSGVGLLAVELGVPIIPIKTFGLHGTVPLHAKWPKKRSRVTVRIGQPLYFDHKESYDEVTEKLHHIMETL